MLMQRLLHPDIVEALAASGHGARVLITDGNYPASTRLGENASLVYLNLSPGMLREGPEPPIFRDFAHMLPGIELTRFGRFEFYEEASGPDTCLQIVTGDQRIYANLLLTIGVVSG